MQKMKNKLIKNVAMITLFVIKPFIVPLIILLTLIMLIASITDILYVTFDNDDKIDVKTELKYYDTEYNKERDKSEIKIFFKSVWEFVSKIFGKNEISKYTDWPAEGHYKISSEFGNRKAPTTGASTFHSGIDIPAPEGTKLISIMDGEIVSTGWGGASGYAITIKSNDNQYRFSYYHCSPEFIVSIGETVKKGQVIGKVGPKNVYGITNNPYKDNNGNPTNGATTGCHCHFAVRKNGELIDPLEIIKKEE